MSCSSKMPLPRASIRLMARRATSLSLMRVQSSAKKSALQVISPWAARYCSTDFWRNRPGIRKKGDTACESPDGLAQRRKTLFDLARRLSRRHFANGVVLGVVGDNVALVVNAPHHRRIGARHLPDHEEGRLHTFRCEGLEDAAGVTRQRTIVEPQHDLMIVKRQRFGVLHGADTGILVGIDHECAADPERARWALSAFAAPISKTRVAPAAAGAAERRDELAASLDHLVGEREHLIGNLKPESLCGLEIDDQFEPGRLQHWQIHRGGCRRAD